MQTGSGAVAAPLCAVINGGNEKGQLSAGLFLYFVWLHDLDSNQGPSD